MPPHDTGCIQRYTQGLGQGMTPVKQGRATLSAFRSSIGHLNNVNTTESQQEFLRLIWLMFQSQSYLH